MLLRFSKRKRNFKKTNDSRKLLLDGDYAKYYKQLKQMYSGKIVSRTTIKKIENDKSLNNPMYLRYKKILKYARYILESKNLIYEDKGTESGVSGFLLDISELWEIYLAKIISNHFKNYSVSSQTNIKIYEKTRINRSMFPDIVMESEDSIVIIDAKFKRMNFENKDVDRNDLHQIHSYAGYYNVNKEKKLKLCSLVYPTEKEEEEIVDKLYGLENHETKFSIGYITVGENFSNMIKNEEMFLNRLENILI